MAGYVVKTLGSDEEVVYRANFNWTFSFFPVLWFALGCAPSVMYMLLQFGQGIAFDRLVVGWWFAGVAALIGAIILLTHLVALWTTEIVVTTFRFVFKTGFISRNTQEVSLSKIEEVVLHQSVWGRVFGYGKLTIRGTGVGVIELPNLDDPIEVRRVIETTRSKLRTRGGEANGDV